MLALGLVNSFALVSICLARPVLASQEPSIRVLVFEGKQLRMRADGQKLLSFRGLGVSRKKIRGLRVRQKDGRWILNFYDHPARRIALNRKDELRVGSRDPRGIWLENRRYHGELRLSVVANKLQVVNHLGIEDYLASVVGGEMPNTWPMAALQAQAVAARTYALTKLGKHGRYDINSTENNQVYLGIESETQSTNEAVNSTRSLVLTHKGRLINAVFHSSSGGFTEASGAVWKVQLPYLIGVPDHDQHSPKHFWERSFNQERLQEIFSETGGVKEVRLIAISPTGRVLKARVFGPKRDQVLTGKELRRRLGLQSTLARFKMLSYDPLEKPSFDSVSLSLKPLNLIEESPSGAMRDSLNFWSKGDAGRIFDKKRPASLPSVVVIEPQKQSTNVLLSERSLLLLPPPAPLPPLPQDKFLFVKGFGAGHGVGMSQWGAHGLAKRGSSFREILTHYYKGVAIRPYSRRQHPFKY